MISYWKAWSGSDSKGFLSWTSCMNIFAAVLSVSWHPLLGSNKLSPINSFTSLSWTHPTRSRRSHPPKKQHKNMKNNHDVSLMSTRMSKPFLFPPSDNLFPRGRLMKQPSLFQVWHDLRPCPKQDTAGRAPMRWEVQGNCLARQKKKGPCFYGWNLMHYDYDTRYLVNSM